MRVREKNRRAEPTVPLAERTGSFRFWTAEQRWEWSDEVAALHGYAPDEVTPTTELLLSHKHPDDRAEVADTLAMVTQTGLPFSSRHRIIDTAGVTHHVLVVGDRMHDDTGAVVGTAGFYIDVTDTVDEERRETLDEMLPEKIAARETIEQAKGALMMAYGITADRAFQVWSGALRRPTPNRANWPPPWSPRSLASAAPTSGYAPASTTCYSLPTNTTHRHPETGSHNRFLPVPSPASMAT